MTVTEIMISAIRAQVCGIKDINYGEISQEAMRSLYTLSKSHDMTHLVFAELSKRNMLTDGNEISQKFRKQHMLAILRHERLHYEYGELCRVLEEASLPFLPLKGSVLRQYYPEPWMRTSCDIDILVHENDLEQAIECLRSTLHYKVDTKGSHDVSLFSENGVHLELHYDLVEDEIANNCKRILQNAWKYSHVKSDTAHHHQFSDEMFYFYHIAHMAKHFENGGCGIRPFLDLWILEHSVEHDAIKRDELLREGNLLTFANSVRQLSEVWFGNRAHNDTTLQMEKYLLFGGVYGSIQNRVAIQQFKQGGKLRYILSRIFIPYDSIKFHYPILQKHRWLTPIMEVRRWCKLIFCGGLKRSVTEINATATVSSETQTSTRELLDKIGL
ncbi:MAG: nucleotidyltransferase family protein [Clostridia bacterium]|nr:nucleotidyltransferase family protein [Clostridia bacterium]